MHFLFLFFIQLIWASSYTAQKMAVAVMPVGLVLIFRYGLATLFFFLAGRLNFKTKFSNKEWLLIIFVGVLTFTASPFFQLTSLTMTTAIDTSILISFEPLITTLMAVFFLKEKLQKITWVAFAAATLGVAVMAFPRGNVGALQWTRISGDLIFLLAIVCEGAYSTASRHLVQKYPPLTLVAWMMLAGFTANLLANFPLLTAQNLRVIPPAAWLNVIYLALFCSVLGYGVWVSLLKKIPVNQLALSLFLQPILGSALAVLILKERFNLQTLVGSLMVFLTLLFWLILRMEYWPKAMRNKRSPTTAIAPATEASIETAK